MSRYKTIIGRRFHTRTPHNQNTEAKIGCSILNRMTALACRPPSYQLDRELQGCDRAINFSCTGAVCWPLCAWTIRATIRGTSPVDFAAFTGTPGEIPM